MPSHYFSHRVELSGNKSIEFFFIDTIWFAPNESKKTKVSNQKQKYQEQLSWLQQSLQSSTSNWLIVVGHYPVFSVGEHGDCADNAVAIQNLLEKHQVDLYLCGHDHTMQHLQNNGIDYYVNGNGAKRGSVGNSQNTMAESLKFARVDPGFMLHQVSSSGDTMTTTVIDYNGNAIYKHQLQSKRALQ